MTSDAPEEEPGILPFQSPQVSGSQVVLQQSRLKNLLEIAGSQPLSL